MFYYDTMMNIHLALQKRGIAMTYPMQSFMHDLYTTISNNEPFLQDSLVILKHSLQIY